MLSLKIEETELYDEVLEEFTSIKPFELRLEHSLVSISKWESKWKKPFLDDKPKTSEEVIDYVRCMTLNQNVDDRVYSVLTSEHIKAITEYIEDTRTATWFSKEQGRAPSREVVTSELVYYWMVAHQIPFETQKWHFNRLMTLIHICNVKNSEPKKMSKSEILSRNRELNAARRAKLKSRG